MIIIVYGKVFVGGAETLIYRISKWYVSRGIEVVLLVESFDESSSEYMENLFGIKKVKIENMSKINQVKIEKIIDKYYETEKEIIVITFDFRKFITLEKIKKYACKIKKILYIIDPKKEYESGFKKIYIEFLEGSIYKKIYKNNNVIFMDNICENEAENYYGLKLLNKTEKIFPLPMYINAYTTVESMIRYRQKYTNILAIARADFPFKGYLLGLIENYANLKNRYPNIILTIISYGKDLNKIQEKINECPLNVRKDICLVGPVEYGKLNEYFKTANLFVGMGTTLLDAANHGVPGIVVQPFVCEAITEGFFCENPHLLIAMKNKINIESLIEKVILMSEDEYMDLSFRTHQSLRKVYNIETIMPRLIEFTKKQKNINLEPYLSIAGFVRELKLYLKNRS